MNLEERLQVLRQEHAKCKQQIVAFEAQALRIEGAIAIVGEILAAPPKPLDINRELQRSTTIPVVGSMSAG